MNSVSTAELAICAALCPSVVYIWFKHGRAGFLGWAYLFIFCTLRMVSGAIALSGSSSAITINSVGLSVLLLTASGVLHEARTHLNSHLNHKLEWILVLIYHLACVSGVALLATGASSFQEAKPAQSDLVLVKTGIYILTAAWVVLVGWASITLVNSDRQRMPTAGNKLIWSVLVSLIFIGVRLIYTLVAFTTQNPTLSPSTGSLAVRVVLSVLPELITLFVFVVAGLVTRHCSRDFKTYKDPEGYPLQQSPRRPSSQEANALH